MDLRSRSDLGQLAKGRAPSGAGTLGSVESGPPRLTIVRRRSSVESVGTSRGEGPEMAGVLVIDDEQDVLLLCRLNLPHAGFEVRVADSGERGLAEAIEYTPDAVVLDLMMPGMDGFEVLRRLRKDERTREVPVLVLTVKTAREDRLRCDALGVNTYLTKPFSPPDLARHLAALIEASASRER